MKARGWAGLVTVIAALGCSDDGAEATGPGVDAALDVNGSDSSTADAAADGAAGSGGGASDGGVEASTEGGADAMPEDPIMVAVGYGGRRMRSLDLGLSWTDLIEDDPDGGDDQNLLRAALFAEGLFVAVGWRIWTSPDGASWTERTLSGQQWCGGLAHGNGRFVCVGGCSKTLVSDDGISWAEGGDVTSSCNHLRSLAFGAGVFVALGDQGIAYSSTDGESWEAGETIDAAGIVFRDGEFRANGDGVHVTSKDGKTWQTHPGETNTEDHGFGVWLRGAWKGKIERSTDGTSWNGVFDDDGNALEAFAFGG